VYKKAITHPTKDDSSTKDEINLVSRLNNKTVEPHEVGKRNRFGPKINIFGAYFSSVQSLSHVQLFATPWTTARQVSLSITNSWSLLKLMSIESVMPSNHLIFCRPFSSRLRSFPASGAFQMSQLFTSGDQSIGVSASTSVLPVNIQD